MSVTTKLGLSFGAIRNLALAACVFNGIYQAILVGLSLVPVWHRSSWFVFFLFVIAALAYASVNLFGLLALVKGHLRKTYLYFGWLIINAVGAYVHVALVHTPVQGLVWTWAVTSLLGAIVTGWFILALRAKTAQHTVLA